MSDSRLAVKVGLFVVLGLALMVGLLLGFNKGLTGFGAKYDIQLLARSVGGLTERSAVLMSGVKIGAISKIELAPGGKGVVLSARIEDRYRIHRDAHFVIEQVGFLGDQYVAIYPRDNAAPTLNQGDQIPVEQPFDFQRAARSTSELLDRVKELVENLNGTVTRVNGTLLSDLTLTNAAATVDNFRHFSERSRVLVDGVGRLVDTNSPAIFISVSNMVRFSKELGLLASELGATVASNRIELTSAVKNLDETSKVLRKLANAIDSGEGVVGSMLKDQHLKMDVANTVSNLASLSSNLNRYGLLYKPKKTKKESPQGDSYPGRKPF